MHKINRQPESEKKSRNLPPLESKNHFSHAINLNSKAFTRITQKPNKPKP